MTVCVIIGFKEKEEQIILEMLERAKKDLGEVILNHYIHNSTNPKSDKVLILLATSRLQAWEIGEWWKNEFRKNQVEKGYWITP